MSLASYLAEKYLNKEVVRKKKQTKKDDETINIIDADLTGWTEAQTDRKKNLKISKAEKAHEALRKAQLNCKTLFKKGDQSSWQKIASENDTEQDSLDLQNAPVVLTPEGKEIFLGENECSEDLKMLNGTRAGLQTAKQVASDLKRQKDKERIVFQTADPQLTGKDAETIYRDASGRRVDMELVIMERQRQKAKEEARKKLELEMSKGEVQKQQKLEEKQRMEEMKHVPFSRSIDDPELNQFLKEKERWNDPAAAFLTKKKTSNRPVYKGYYSANRFGIPPGYRWDGVDRGNGFEKAWFAHQSEKKAQEAQAYSWSIEDM